MSERLANMILALDDADIFHEEREEGDSRREPDENTEDDVFLGMRMRGFSNDEILRYLETGTLAYRIKHGRVDPQG